MKAFIITLKDHEWSEKLSNESIEQANKFNIVVEKFDAIVGKTYPEHIKENNLFLHPKRDKTLTEGTFGCFFSHFYLWKKCIELDEPIIILEHDGYFIKLLPDNILDKFNDLMKLDCFNPYDLKYNKWINNTMNDPITYKNDISKIYAKRVFGWYTWGAYAYIIKPTGANKLVNFCKQHGFSAPDNMLADKVLEIVIPSSPIARLHPIFNGSNIKKLTTLK